MRIRITRPNHFIGCWYDKRIGEEFDIVGFRVGAPSHYDVDVSHLKERGELTEDRAAVPECDAELVPVDRDAIRLRECLQTLLFHTDALVRLIAHPGLQNDAEVVACAENYWHHANELQLRISGPTDDEQYCALLDNIDSDGLIEAAEGVVREDLATFHLEKMMGCDSELFKRIMDTPNVAFHFNELMKLARFEELEKIARKDR